MVPPVTFVGGEGLLSVPGDSLAAVTPRRQTVDTAYSSRDTSSADVRVGTGRRGLCRRQSRRLGFLDNYLVLTHVLTHTRARKYTTCTHTPTHAPRTRVYTLRGTHDSESVYIRCSFILRKGYLRCEVVYRHNSPPYVVRPFSV